MYDCVARERGCGLLSRSGSFGGVRPLLFVMATDPKKCTAKHTKYDPPTEEFRCPKCDAEAGDFAIDEPDEEADSDCPRLHVKDVLHCCTCRHTVGANSFVTRLQKAANMVSCPTCKGHGLIKGGGSRGGVA